MRSLLARRAFLAVLGWVAASTIAACGGDVDRVPLEVFAAASLREAFTEIGAEFARAHPDVRVIVNFAGSQTLRTQIEQGARVDVFASADLSHAEALDAQGLLDGAPVVFARNELVLAVPDANPAELARLEDLTRPRLRIVMATEAVPAGKYAREALARFAARTGAPEFPGEVLGLVASFEPNVRLVAAKLELREADAGFVYRTDVIASEGRLRAIALPPAALVDAPYPIAVARESARPEQAHAFRAFVLREAGQRILRDHGFSSP